MKLLADLPAEDVEESHHRPVAAILGGVAVLVVMLGIGAALLVNGGPAGGDDGSAGGDASAGSGVAALSETGEGVDLARWATEAGAACRAVAAAHPQVVSGAGASPAEMDRGVRALAEALRALPLPTDRDARAQSLVVVTLVDQAEQAWYGISALDADDVVAGDLAAAETLTGQLVAELAAVGAGCSSPN